MLGHMVWGYVAGRASCSLLNVRINPYLVMFLAALPDIDLLLGVFGIEHRTWTHSILLWSLIFVPIFIKYRKRGIPYFIAPIQHILLGDVIVGAWNKPLWPLNSSNFALGYGLLSIENIALEAAGLLFFLVLVFGTREGRNMFFINNRKKRYALYICLPILPLIAFAVLAYSFNWIVSVLTENGLLESNQLFVSIPRLTQQPLFATAVAMHVVLIIALSIPLISKLLLKSKEKSLDSKY